VLHADSEGEHIVLMRRLRSFRWSAIRALNELSENDQLPSDLQERIAREIGVLAGFQFSNLQYQGPSGGVQAAEEEEDTSFYEPMQSGVAATAASELEEEDDEEEGDEEEDDEEEDDEEEDDEEEDDEDGETSEEQSDN
jgi:hypothetical protein